MDFDPVFGICLHLFQRVVGITLPVGLTGVSIGGIIRLPIVRINSTALRRNRAVIGRCFILLPVFDQGILNGRFNL